MKNARLNGFVKFVLAITLLAAGFFACNVNEAGKTFLKVQVDSSWLAYDSVEITLVNKKNEVVETLFAGKPISIGDFDKLRTEKYTSGEIRVVIKGFNAGTIAREEGRNFSGESGKNIDVEVVLDDRDTTKQDTTKIPEDTTQHDTTKAKPRVVIKSAIGLKDTTLTIKDSLKIAVKIILDSGALKTYSWDIEGDGKLDDSGSLSGDTLNIKGKGYYPKAGDYVVKLFLRASADSEDSVILLTAKVKILQDAPKAYAGLDTTVYTGTKVVLSGKGEDSLGTIAKLEWKVDTAAYLESKDGKIEITAPNAAGKVTAVLRVTDDDGLTAVDTAIVNVLKPGDPNLTSLVASGCVLEPAFDPATLVYACKAPYQAGPVAMTLKAEGSGKMKVNDKDLVQGATSDTFSVSTEKILVGLSVWNSEGLSHKDYQITLERIAASTDNSLSALTISSGTLTPVFASGTYAYTGSVINTVSQIKIAATPTSSSATWTLSPAADTAGYRSLLTGANAFSVVVKAQNGDEKTYTVTITRAKNANANLDSLVVSGGTLAPVFSSGTTAYTLSVPYTTTTTTVKASPSANTTTLKLGTAGLAANTVSAPKNLVVGANTLVISTLAEDGTTTKSYSVVVTRASGSTASLASLTLTPAGFTPVFSPSVLSYVDTVASTVASIQITASTTDLLAKVKVYGQAESTHTTSGVINLSAGANNFFDITVTAQDGSTSLSYSFAVYRMNAPLELSGLTLSAGTLAPAFSSSDTAYTTDLLGATTSMTLTPTVANPTLLKIVVNGDTVASGSPSSAIALSLGHTTIAIKVIRLSDAATKSYSMDALRHAPTIWRRAYLWTNSATTTYTLPVDHSTNPSNTYYYNPGGPIVVTHNSTGNTSVNFQGFNPLNQGGGHYQVTAYGGAAKDHCVISSWGSETANIYCTDGAGTLKDVQFSLLGQFPIDSSAGGNGYVWASTSGAAAPTISSTYAWNSTFQLPTATRSAVGTYGIVFPGMAASNTSPGSSGGFLVSSYGSTTGRCRLTSWGTGTASIQCTDGLGVAMDASFNATYTQPLANTKHAYAWIPVLTDTVTMNVSSAQSLYAHNSQGNILAKRTSTGNYTITFKSLSGQITGQGPNVQVTPWGSTAANCRLTSWSGASGSGDVLAYVACEALATGTAVDVGLGIWVIW